MAETQGKAPPRVDTTHKSTVEKRQGTIEFNLESLNSQDHLSIPIIQLYVSNFEEQHPELRQKGIIIVMPPSRDIMSQRARTQSHRHSQDTINKAMQTAIAGNIKDETIFHANQRVQLTLSHSQ
jgi:hypothetical protein